MAKDKKGKTPVNNAGRPTGSYSSYGTSGYGSPYGGGYGSTGGGYGGRGPSPYGSYGSYGSYGANNGMPQAPNNAPQSPAQQQAVANDDAKAKGKDKKKSQNGNSQNNGKKTKLEKRQEKFKEDELKYYPMTVGGWIVTFILLAIPIVGSICTICWFFGVGNRSRVAWVRSKLVAILLVIALIVALLGTGYGILYSKAKNVEVVFDGVSYGKLGDYKAKGVLYFVLSFAVDTFGEKLIGQFIGGDGGEQGGEVSSGEDEPGSGEPSISDQGKDAVKLMLAKKLGFKPKTSSNGDGGSTGSGNQIGSGNGVVGSGNQEGVSAAA